MLSARRSRHTYLDTQPNLACCIKDCLILRPVILLGRGFDMAPPDVDHNTPDTQALQCLQASPNSLQDGSNSAVLIAYHGLLQELRM